MFDWTYLIFNPQNHGKITRIKQHPPSPEAVKEFVAWLRENGVEPSEARRGPNETRRLIGVEAMGRKWSARDGVEAVFPSKRALLIAYFPTDGELGPSAEWGGCYDSESGQRCGRGGDPMEEDEELWKGELSDSEFHELVAAFMAQGGSEKIRNETIGLWENR